MKAYQEAMIACALKHNALRFGTFPLKSGRISPYFFNAGVFSTGEALAEIGPLYCQAIQDLGVGFDCFFGPAYKGIPLVCAVSQAWYLDTKTPAPFAFNRKAAKAYGDGGQMVGADIQGKRLILIDDTITAGTAIRDAAPLWEEAGATLAGVVVALDRQEYGPKAQDTAFKELEAEFNVPVRGIISLDDIFNHLKNTPDLQAHIPEIEAYRKQYCPS